MLGCQVLRFHQVIGQIVKLSRRIVNHLCVGVLIYLRTLARFDVFPMALPQRQRAGGGGAPHPDRNPTSSRTCLTGACGTRRAGAASAGPSEFSGTDGGPSAPTVDPRTVCAK